MTGTFTTKTHSSGRTYYYIALRYKDPKTGLWRGKLVSTHIQVTEAKKKKAHPRPVNADKLMAKAYNDYAYLEEDISELSAGLDPMITLGAYLDVLLQRKKNDIRTSTYDKYTYQINRLKRDFEISRKPDRSITTPQVKAFLETARLTGKINQKTGEREPLSVRTVREYKALLVEAFTCARIDGLIKYDPTAGLKVSNKSNKKFSEDYLFLKEDEIQDMLEYLSKNDAPLLPIAFMGVYMGLRRSEILGLKWSAIDWDHKIVHIRHTVVRERTVYAEDQTKSLESRRDLHLFPTAEICLKKILAQQILDKKFFKDEYQNKDGYVFCWPDGHSYDPNWVSRRFKTDMQRFGRPEITLHKLRHTCASLLLDKNWNIKKVQYWLGHEDPDTTLRIYTHYMKHQSNMDSGIIEDLSAPARTLFA